MMKHTLSLFIFLFIGLGEAFSQQEATTSEGKKVFLYDDSTWSYTDGDPLYNIKPSSFSKLEIPKIKNKEIVIEHFAYSLSYNEKHEQANWVAYELTSVETNKAFERTDKFLIDPKVKSGTANDKDYSDSGYDREHLAPASDMGWSEASIVNIFFTK